MTIYAHSLNNDQAVLEAKNTLLSKIKEYSKNITEIKPAENEYKVSFEKVIEAYSEARGGKLYFPYLSSGLGNGALVQLEDGSIKYDFIIGIGVHIFGHSHEKVLEASLNAALEDTVMQGNLQQNKTSYEFTKLIIEQANKNGAKLAHCFLTSSGVMAGENAVKIAFHNKQPADRILAFEGCFMGRTLAFSQYTDKAANRVGLPTNCKIDYIPFFDPKDPKGSTERALNVLKKNLARYPGHYAAMSFELILGEGGFYAAPKEFYVTLMQELKKNNVLILIDEVQTFARTSELFAFQHFGLDEYVDIVWIGKASQVCATIYKGELKPKPGLLSQTYTSSTTAIASGKAVIETLIDENYLGSNGKNIQIQNHFHKQLDSIKEKHPDLLEGPYGIGSMVAFTPLDGEKETAVKFIKELFDAGVMGFMAGTNPTRARFLIPAMAVSFEDIDNVCKIIENTLLKLKK